MTARIGSQVAPGHRLDVSLLASNMVSQYDANATADDTNRHSLIHED